MICINCKHDQSLHSSGSCADPDCKCKAFVPLTANRLQARLKVLERKPAESDRYKELWVELAELYLLFDGKNSPRHSYCLMKAGATPENKDGDDGHYHEWQKWSER